MPGHLTIEERDRIAQLRFRKFSQKEIALAVGRSTSTLSRELQRNSSGEDYLPGQAQQKALERRSERPLARKMDDLRLDRAGRESRALGIVSTAARQTPLPPKKAVFSGRRSHS